MAEPKESKDQGGGGEQSWRWRNGRSGQNCRFGGLSQGNGGDQSGAVGFDDNGGAMVSLLKSSAVEPKGLRTQAWRD